MGPEFRISGSCRKDLNILNKATLYRYKVAHRALEIVSRKIQPWLSQLEEKPHSSFRPTIRTMKNKNTKQP